MSVHLIVHAGGKRDNSLRCNTRVRKKPGLPMLVCPVTMHSFYLD
jgi:hypothetical protein